LPALGSYFSASTPIGTGSPLKLLLAKILLAKLLVAKLLVAKLLVAKLLVARPSRGELPSN
jgi:hypothetical protein